MLRKSTEKIYTTSATFLLRSHREVGATRFRAFVTSGNKRNDLSDIEATNSKIPAQNTQLSFSTNSTSTEVRSSKEGSLKCPFSQVRDLSTSEAVASLAGDRDTNSSEGDKKHPPLMAVPSLPIFGSFFSIIPGIGEPLSRYFNIPKMLPNNMYDFHIRMKKQFGDFYVLDVPSIGKIHTINDPYEMMKVLRNEGAYPKGGISALRAFIKWSKSRNLTLTAGEDNGFFGQGETWKNIRTFMQTDLLSPQAAKGYTPSIVKAAQIASRGAGHYADDLNLYFNYCAFDMFSSVMFGELTKTADPSTKIDPINREFVENSILSLALMMRQNFDKYESIKGSMGIVTETYKRYEKAQDRVNEISNEKVLAFKQKWERSELNKAEKASYIAHTFERQKKERTVSTETMSETIMLMLNAGVDTTANFISWAMVHLALNPEVQEKLYKELKQNIDENGGILSSDIISKKKSPYLHAVLRESHRLTPIQPATMLKSNSSKDIKIHGRDFPRGTLFVFESYTKGLDPHYVESPDEFNPGRWTAEAIESRKDTASAILDHQFYKDPFSQGARRCPGSRVAMNETLVLLSQIVLDWKFEPKEFIESLKDVEYEKQTFLVPKIPKMKFIARNPKYEG